MSTSVSTAIQVSREDLNPCTVLLTVTCPPELVATGFAKAIKKLGKNLRIPGFRPGLAPRKMVEDMLNPNDLFQAAADEIVKVGYEHSLKQEELNPHAQPAINITKLEKEPAECEFTIKIPLEPQVELGDVKTITVTRTKVEVTDQDVENQLEQLRKREGKKQEIVDRGIEPGDAAVINIKLEGSDDDGRTFMVMAGQTFADLDQAISGMKAEEIKSAELTFPDNFQDMDWAGKKSSVTVTVRNVSALQLPELDDEFAKNLKIENVEQLKAQMRASIEAAKLQIGQDMVNEQLLEKLLSASTIFVADNTWEVVADRRLREIAQELGTKGKTLEQYAQQNNMTLDQLVDAQKEEAKMHVKRAVMIERIFVREKMQVTEADANRHFALMAREYNIPPDQVQKFVKEYGPQLRDEIIFRSMHSKVMDFLLSQATIQEVDAPEPEASQKPAPKTKSKAKK